MGMNVGLGRDQPIIGATLRLETPEGVEVEVRPAGPVVRGIALLIDESIAQLGTIIVLIALAIAGRAGIGVFMVIFFVVEWFYPVLFEVLRGGQTPGKKLMGLRVLNADATPIGWNASLLRNLLRVADVLPAFYMTGLASMCLTSRFQRLGDLAAHTLVVHEDRPAGMWGAIGPEAFAALSELGARRASVSLSLEEQRVLLSFAESRC